MPNIFAWYGKYYTSKEFVKIKISQVGCENNLYNEEGLKLE